MRWWNISSQTQNIISSISTGHQDKCMGKIFSENHHLGGNVKTILKFIIWSFQANWNDAHPLCFYRFILLQKLRCKLNVQKFIRKWKISSASALQDKISEDVYSHAYLYNEFASQLLLCIISDFSKKFKCVV
jgi:hypothetical protein